MSQNHPQAAPIPQSGLRIEQTQNTPRRDADMLGRITAKDVEEARHLMELRYQEWLSFGPANPCDITIAQANDRRRESKEAWQREIRASLHIVRAYAWAKCIYYLHRHIVPLLRSIAKWNDIGTFGALLIVGTLGAGLGAIVAIAFCSKLASAMAVVASAFLLGVAFSMGALLTVRGPTEEELHQIERERREQEFRRERARAQYETARKECIRLEKEALARNRYEEAKRKYERSREIQQSKKNELLLRDWRSLRGVPFEDFLKEVFEDQGYSVQTTKTSGDQGVDLIVIIDGNRVAIQSKGYESSVGNSSVQEVYAGMQYYNCDACAVITNSHFTPAAIDLARSTGCQLIDGSDIPKLIRGELVLLVNSK